MRTESVFVSWGRGTKELQTEGLQAAETYSLTTWRQKSSITVLVVGLFPRGSPRAPAVPGSAARCRARVGATWDPGRVSSATSSSSEDGDPGAGWSSQDSWGGQGVLRDHLALTVLWLVQVGKSSLGRDVLVVDCGG